MCDFDGLFESALDIYERITDPNDKSLHIEVCLEPATLVPVTSGHTVNPELK